MARLGEAFCLFGFFLCSWDFCGLGILVHLPDLSLLPAPSLEVFSRKSPAFQTLPLSP